MSKFNISAGGKSLSVELVVIDNNFIPQGRTFYCPSISLANNVIKFNESGCYKMTLKLNEIGTIGGSPAPATIEQAFQDIKDLIDSIGAI